MNVNSSRKTSEAPFKPRILIGAFCHSCRLPSQYSSLSLCVVVPLKMSLSETSFVGRYKCVQKNLLMHTKAAVTEDVIINPSIRICQAQRKAGQAHAPCPFVSSPQARVGHAIRDYRNAHWSGSAPCCLCCRQWPFLFLLMFLQRCGRSVARTLLPWQRAQSG